MSIWSKIIESVSENVSVSFNEEASRDASKYAIVDWCCIAMPIWTNILYSSIRQNLVLAKFSRYGRLSRK